jgi:hypothetical protein
VTNGGSKKKAADDNTGENVCYRPKDREILLYLSFADVHKRDSLSRPNMYQMPKILSITVAVFHTFLPYGNMHQVLKRMKATAQVMRE